jgi:hypothetical protein
MSIWLNTVIGSMASIPDDFTDFVIDCSSHDFKKTLLGKELNTIANKFNYEIELECDDDDEYFFTFGRKAAFNLIGLPKRSVHSFTSLMKPEYFPSNEEKELITKSLTSFLDSLSEKHIWIKEELDWSNVDMFLLVTS